MRCSPIHRGNGLLTGHVRLTGLTTGTGAGDGPVWIDVPESVAADIPDRMDAWLLWLLPHAFETQQELILDGAVDRKLLQNAERLMEIWSRWRPDRRLITIRAQPVDASECQPKPELTGLFFTGGVDSFFTLFHNDESASADSVSPRRPVDDLVYVWGFDIPLTHREAFERKLETLGRIADGLGKNLITFATNLRETGIRQPWGPVMHGPALGGVGLLLGKRWKTMLLSSSFCHGDSDPWGSTAITDPLLSTSVTLTEHFGAGHDRFEKLAFLTRYPQALETLHVCWEERSEGNCGLCEKCYRTLLALDTLGIRGTASFPARSLDLGRLVQLWKNKPLLVRMYVQLRAHAARAGRYDIVAAIDACISPPNDVTNGNRPN